MDRSTDLYHQVVSRNDWSQGAPRAFSRAPSMNVVDLFGSSGQCILYLSTRSAYIAGTLLKVTQLGIEMASPCAFPTPALLTESHCRRSSRILPEK